MPRLLLFPSRGDNDRVIVCEGKSDAQLIDGILANFSSDIFVIDAGGEDKVNTVRDLLNPAISIKDRDFTMSPQEAQATLTNQRVKCFWTRYEIEGYLLYPDWIYEALVRIQQTPKGRSYYVPNDPAEIEQTIIQITSNLIDFHCGHQTLRDMLTGLKPGQIFNLLLPSNSESLSLVDWELHLSGEANRLINDGSNLSQNTILDAIEIRNLLQKNHTLFTTQAISISDIQIHFSTKRIFRDLALHWGGRYKWQVLRDEVITIAVEYSQNITGLLSNDPRLGDFGLLATKILGTPI